MKKILTIIALALLMAAPASAQKLVILHVNDTHSHLEPEREGRNANQGGVIERAAYIDSVRTAVGKNRVLLLHGGDWDQGTPYFTLLGGYVEANLLNALGYDCVTLGNHEFDNDIEELCGRLKVIKAPVVCASYDFSPYEIGNYVKPYTIVKKAGMKIGIIGAICDLSTVVVKSVSDRLVALDSNVEINKWADYLKNEAKCDLVILLSHLGYAEDQEFIPQSRNIDIVVGGHSHTFVKDFVYPVDKDGKAVPVIQDGCFGVNVGRIDVY